MGNPHGSQERRAVGLGNEILRALETSSPLPPAPDRERLDAWLVSAHRRAWADRSLLGPAAVGSG